MKSSLSMIGGHDPTFLAWLITGAYFVAAVAALLAARCSIVDRDRIFWIGCTALLILLGFNKQLDLQGFVTSAGRSLAQQEGWFNERRLVQAIFILVLFAAAAISLSFLAAWLRRSAGPIKVAAIGVVLLTAFVVMRAASFHHMDRLVTRTLFGMRSGWWLELAGILVIGLSAESFRRRNRAPTA